MLDIDFFFLKIVIAHETLNRSASQIKYCDDSAPGKGGAARFIQEDKGEPGHL